MCRAMLARDCQGKASMFAVSRIRAIAGSTSQDTGEFKKRLMPTIFAFHTGKTVGRVGAVEVPVNNLFQIRPPARILALADDFLRSSTRPFPLCSVVLTHALPPLSPLRARPSILQECEA